MNFKLLSNFLFYTKYSNIENLMNKFKIKNFEILNNLEYKKVENLIFNDKDKLTKKFKYYIFDINASILKDNLIDIQKFILLLKRKRINFIFLITSKNIINLFDYIIIDKNIKEETPYLKNLNSVNNKKGILKKFEGPYNLSELKNKYDIEILYNKNINNMKFYDTYFIEGINKYAIRYKYNNDYILLNNNNTNTIIESILFYHPFTSYLSNLFLSPNYLIEIKNLLKKYKSNEIDKKYFVTFFKLLLKLENFYTTKQNTNETEFNYRDFYILLTKIINKFNIKLEILKLDTFPHVVFKKIK